MKSACRVVLLGCLAGLCLAGAAMAAPASPGNRLVYLHENDPFYPGLNFPRLTTPQWIGEPGVEAVVILAVDDMRDVAKYEAFLRPILNRLKKIDGRAPISIMTVAVTPQEAQLQAWLKEGLSIDVHTLTHPCPLLQQGNFDAAAQVVHGGVDLLSFIPGNRPVAFRMPCCDSMNSTSPRFFAEIFNRASPSGKFLTIDSSVMNLLTPKDTSLPRNLVLDADGREKFRKYFPKATNSVIRRSLESFATTIEDYPYPYVIGKLCWEFPATVPSDWEAQNVNGTNSPVTVADWKAALDATLLKQGVFTFVFHPHGWIRAEQMVEFIDYAVAKHGGKVKFLTFREAQERLDRNLLAGQPLRAASGQDNGVRILDVNHDGFMDVVVGNETLRRTRLWEPAARHWRETSFPAALSASDGQGNRVETGTQFGVLRTNGLPTVFYRSEFGEGAWHFDGRQWNEDKNLFTGLRLPSGHSIHTREARRDRGVRLRDADNDGVGELLVGNESQNAAFGWSTAEKTWKPLFYGLPNATSIVDGQGRDAGLRFMDLNGDGFDDVIFSNPERFSVHLFVPVEKRSVDWKLGWTQEFRDGKRGDPDEIPMISRGGAEPNNGAWFHSGAMWVQNEDTAKLPDKVQRLTFDQILANSGPPPKSPAESLAAIRVRPGFKVELVAAEPLVRDPIAFDWGADGKLWVVEMGDYPLGTDGKGTPGGIVRFLEDTDGDGAYDKSTVFLDGVNFPTGVMPWGKGVLVSTAPNIFYAEDTDGDGRADLRKTLFTGFAEGNQQHRVNGFDYGLDNWIYGANGDSGGTVKSLATGKSFDIGGRDFRFRPQDGAFQTQAGRTQYGRHRDDWGNWFGNNNSTWAWHYFLPEQYLARNPHLAVKSARQELANYPDNKRVFPISPAVRRFNWPNAVNTLTSGCGAAPYRDELFGAEFASSLFICEPVNNLVHREILQPDGVTFTSRRAADEAKSEFLASADNWFRPVFAKTGPDGALYLADMYRLVLEHPEWIPKEIAKRTDLRAGHDKGRIYRVYPASAKLRKPVRLDQLNAANLAAALDSPSGWQRDTAQRLLVEQQSKSAALRLEVLAEKNPNPKVRLQALCTLDGLKSLKPEVLVRALADSHPAVREQAVRLSEPLLAGSSPLATAILKLVDDPEVRVRYQLAFSLGEWSDPRVGRALAGIAMKDLGSAHIQTAVMSSAAPHTRTMLEAVFNSGRAPAAALVEQLISLAVAANDADALLRAANEITRADGGKFAAWQFAALAGMLDTLERRGLTLNRFAATARTDVRPALEKLDSLFPAARKAAQAIQADEAHRLAVIRVLGHPHTGRAEDLQRLGELLRPQEPVVIQEAALASLGRATGGETAAILLNRWRSLGPALRLEVLNVLLRRQEWIQQLLAVIERGEIPPSQISPIHRQKLLAHSNANIQSSAARLFAVANADRAKVIRQYDRVGELKGVAASGANVFRQHCASCHRLNGEGSDLGPDLGAVADKPVDALLAALFDPNQAVESRYLSYTAVTKSER
ncbi:MAG: c-type cytochrome, partial [Verrucomicrobia bacterium]|nr:c-type cytochrome [Verrucomicrobiota bacterium]